MASSTTESLVEKISILVVTKPFSRVIREKKWEMNVDKIKLTVVVVEDVVFVSYDHASRSLVDVIITPL